MESNLKQQPSKASPWTRRVLVTACLISFVLAAGLSYLHLTYKNTILVSTKAELKQHTINVVYEINAILTEAMGSTESLAVGLTKRTVNPTNMHDKLKAMLAGNDNFNGATVTFAPYAYNANTRLYSAYYSKTGVDGELRFKQLADVYDYTTPKYDWYVEPMTKGNRWGEPYWDEAGKTYMVTYSALFYGDHPEAGQQAPEGVVTVDISMSRMKDFIESLDIGPSGFIALTTRGGNYLYHPNNEYVQLRRNLRDIAHEKNDKDRLKVADMVASSEGGIIDHVSTTTGQESWLIFEPVPISGWSVQNTFIKDGLAMDVDTLRRQIIWIIILAIVFLSSLSALLLGVQPNSSLRIWILTAVISLLLIIGVSMIWNLALNYYSADRLRGDKISDKAILASLMQDYEEISEQKDLPKPLFVATGLFIDAIKFSNANDVLVTGRVWQKYPVTFPKDLVKGILIGRAKGVKFTETAKRVDDGQELLQWSFQAELRVQMDYSRYPLEVEQLVMQLLPLDTDENIVLVPDLDAYKLTTAALLPGLDEEVFIPGWKLTESFFLFRSQQKNTNFGIKKNFDQQLLPTLHYVIGIKRMFIDAFISNLTPLIIVAIVLFSVVLLSTEVEIGKVLSVCVAVFFVVVFSHLDIRKSISAGEVFYLEYFFFVIYFAIIFAPMNSFRSALSMRSKFFEFEHGLLPKLSYWPIITGAFFLITVFKFY